jgi:hypothetical protein
VAPEGLGHVADHRGPAGRLDPASGDVPDQDRQAPVGEHPGVVEVASDLEAGGGLVEGGQLEPVDLGQALGQQRLLERLGDVALLLELEGVLERRGSVVGQLAQDPQVALAEGVRPRAAARGGRSGSPPVR